MSPMTRKGRSDALRSLEGRHVSPAPVALFTWGFDYTWQIAGLEPWQLACGTADSWHAAYLSLVNRHRPDLIFYSGNGVAALPRLLSEDNRAWYIESCGRLLKLDKTSLALSDAHSGAKSCDSVGEMRTNEEVNECIGTFRGWGEPYLSGLSRLIEDLGDSTLVLPHHSPAYICACYAFGFERSMMLMLEDPDLFTYACDLYSAGDVLRMTELRAAGAEAVFIADGWASCDIISPAMVERFALPYQRSITDAAHRAGLRIILWNEGDIRPILEAEAAIPFDAFAFEQPRKGCDISVDIVREVFGPSRCLFGNLDSEGLFGRNDPDEINSAVRTQLISSGYGAPFILSTGSPIPSFTRPEAIDAMMRAARGFIHTV